MRAKWRSYTHDLYEVLLGITSENVRTEMGQVYQRKDTIQVQGKLLAASRSALIAKMNALKAAYQVNATGDFTFSYADGTLVHRFRDSDTIGGVRVVRPPEFPADIHSYVNFIPYALTLEATFANALVRYLSFHETLSFEGGEPEVEFLVPTAGLSQPQMIHEATPYRCVQAGQVVGHLSYPLVPSPKFPQAPKIVRKLRPGSPKRQGNSLVEWPLEYEYEFGSPLPLVGLPNVPPL